MEFFKLFMMNCLSLLPLFTLLLFVFFCFRVYKLKRERDRIEDRLIEHLFPELEEQEQDEEEQGEVEQTTDDVVVPDDLDLGSGLVSGKNASLVYSSLYSFFLVQMNEEDEDLGWFVENGELSKLGGLILYLGGFNGLSDEAKRECWVMVLTRFLFGDGAADVDEKEARKKLLLDWIRKNNGLAGKDAEAYDEDDEDDDDDEDWYEPDEDDFI